MIKVLSIEDNRADAFLVEEMLRSNFGDNMRLRWEGHLPAALDRLSESSFDIVLLDLGLGESHGLDTFRSVATAAKNMPILVVSGLDDQEVADQTVELGAKAYLVKGSFSEDNLSDMVNRIIEESRVEIPSGLELSQYLKIVKILKLEPDLSSDSSELESQYARIYSEFFSLADAPAEAALSPYTSEFNSFIVLLKKQSISTHELVMLHERVVNNADIIQHSSTTKSIEFLLMVSLKLLDQS